jgi:acyl carrier protein
MIPIVFQRVQRIAADVFSVPIAYINAESSADTIETWDSLQHLNFVLAVEQEFGVQFTPEEIEKLISVNTVVEMLEAKPRTGPA